MKKIRKFFLFCFLSIFFPLMSFGQLKIVYIPDKIIVEKDYVEAITIQNMSEVGIYKTFPIFIIDNFIFIADMDNYGVVKLTFDGKVVKRFGKKGQGPGELLAVWAISRFKENIAITGKYKVIICNNDLQYLREIKLKESFHDLIFATNNRIYFYNNPTYFNYYFSVYSDDFKYLKRFGIKDPNANEKKVTNRNYRYSSDIIRCTLYVPEENGIWVSFRNRYDLRYYKDEKNVLDIKTKSPILMADEMEHMGVKTKFYKDRSLLIARYNYNLFYFYQIGKNIYCDIFDMSKNYILYLRLEFPYHYRRLAHDNGTIFYGLRYASNKENVFLDKIKIQLKRRRL